MPNAEQPAGGITSAPARPHGDVCGNGQSDMSWEVWDDETQLGSFRTLKGAERFAHRYVKQHERPVEIFGNGNHTVAYVRADALGRIWTDVLDGSVL